MEVYNQAKQCQIAISSPYYTSVAISQILHQPEHVANHEIK